MKFGFLAGVCCVVFSFWGFSQTKTIDGYVREKNTNVPLVGVSIYFDGTTLGTITNEEGYFTMEKESSLSAPLVVSFIGYGKKMLYGSELENLNTIFLEERVIQLDEVVLKPDTWSRKKKLTIFRREFLGKTKEVLHCKILNEDVIRLYYNKNDQVLYADAREPLIISNKHLGYTLVFDLTDFNAMFNLGHSGVQTVYSSYFSGTTFFSELKTKKPKRNYIKNREQTYLGSILHFMRSLSNKRIAEENFRIFKGSKEVRPYEYFEIEMQDGVSRVEQQTEILSVLYDKFEQSLMKVEGVFFIDGFGNHSPIENVVFGGDFGLSRVASMLPLNYQLE